MLVALTNKSLEDNGGLAGSLVTGSVIMLSGFRAVPQLWRSGSLPAFPDFNVWIVSAESSPGLIAGVRVNHGFPASSLPLVFDRPARTSAWSRRGIRVSVCLLSLRFHNVSGRAAQAQRSE